MPDENLLNRFKRIEPTNEFCQLVEVRVSSNSPAPNILLEDIIQAIRCPHLTSLRFRPGDRDYCYQPASPSQLQTSLLSRVLPLLTSVTKVIYLSCFASVPAIIKLSFFVSFFRCG